MTLGLTRLQIITQGLSLAGRPDLLADARYWLSMFLEETYMNQDLEWLVKYKTGIIVADGTLVPEDYRASKAATLVHTNGSTSPLTVLTKQDEIEELTHQNAESLGAPRYVYIDQESRSWRFLPGADQSYTMNLRYYYVPEIGEVADDTCDDDIPLWGMPSSILVDHIKSRAYEYNDDQRQESSEVKVRNKFTEAKMNNHDRRAGSSRIQLGKRFKRKY